jgi:hypothetical protein
MRQLPFIIAMFALLLLSGCYPGISGRVVDGMTGKPIEKALVVAQWTKEHGFGLTYHELYKIIETETDKEGYFSIEGPGSPYVEPPEMIIYKEGYIPWRNDMVFPSTDKSKGNEWKDNLTYRLDTFTDKYSCEQLSDFIESSIMIVGLKKVPIYHDLRNKIQAKAHDEIYKKKTSK